MAVISVSASATLIEILPALPVPLKPKMGKTIKYINIKDKFLMFSPLYIFPVPKKTLTRKQHWTKKPLSAIPLTCPAAINKYIRFAMTEAGHPRKSYCILKVFLSSAGS
jgi:hypothetical protein